MKRVGVYTKVLTAAEAVVARGGVYANGELSLLASDGTGVELGASGPYKKGTAIDIVVGTKGAPREVITINPYAFGFTKLAFEAAAGQTVVIGSKTAAGKIVVADPTLASNLNAIGTLSLVRKTLDSGVVAPWGDTFTDDVQIRPGDSVASVLAKLVVVATALVAKINAKYGAGTATLTSDIAGNNKYLQFAFAAGKTFNVTCDGIFDGTLNTMTVADVNIVSGQTGAEVREAETEAAVLDGYNPVQLPKYQLFDLETYLSGVAGTNYDAIQIVTTLPKEYETPGSPTGWDVMVTLYAPTSEGNTLMEALAAILTELQQNHQGAPIKVVAAADAAHAATVVGDAHPAA